MTSLSPNDARARLRKALAEELRRPVMAEAHRVAEHALEERGAYEGPILFYGSCLRAESPEGVMDVYLLPPTYRAFHGGTVTALLNWLIPPNVYFWNVRDRGQTLRAKVAAVSLGQFAAFCRFRSWNPSIWARFCQPAALLHAPSEESTDATVDALVEAVITAARWGAMLGPERGRSRDYWEALFRATYRAELRPERDNRPALVYEANQERYDRLLPLAWAAAGLAYEQDEDGVYAPALSARARRAARWRWLTRRFAGKSLSALRLVKGAFTFAGAVDYLVWKIERHSGARLELLPWQRRHPFLAAPFLFVKLRRQGAVR